MPVQEDFSYRLLKALNLIGWKPADLAKATGFGKSSISQYLDGTNKPRQKRLYILAKKLNVNEAWLMGYDVPMERVPDKLRASSSRYSCLTDSEKNILNGFSLLNIEGQRKAIDYILDLAENDRYKKDLEAKNDERIS